MNNERLEPSCPDSFDLEVEDSMEEMRSQILSRLTRIEKAALFENYDEFWILYRQEREDENV